MKKKLVLLAAVVVTVALAPRAAHAHGVSFKSPGPGMHFTEGHPIIVFADLNETGSNLGIIINGVGWPQMQVLVDGVLWKDSVTNSETVLGSNKTDMNGNPDPIDFYRFSLAGVPAGMHQLVIRGQFSKTGGGDGMSKDSAPITVFVDPVPAGKTMMVLNADVTGPVSWNNVYVVGNGKVVTASGAVTIKDSLVTGLGSMSTTGIKGTSSALDIQGSIFENTAKIELGVTGEAIVKNNEFRANNMLTFVANNPDGGLVIELSGASTVQKRFQGNRVGAGRVAFRSSNWLVGGDTDDLSNVVIGPRGVVNFVNGASNIIFRGNYVRHNYRGGWSQGFNLSFTCNGCNPASGMNNISEHNFMRGGSWMIQSLVGEFRYNVVYGFGHTWVRSTTSGASIHHNLLLPEGNGGFDGGIQLYQSEKNVSIYNNTFDGGGTQAGDAVNPFILLSGTVQVASLRNNLFSFARNAANVPMGPVAVKGAAGNLLSADYNAFYNPDNTNKDNYAVADLTEGTSAGFATHDVSGAGVGQKDAQLAASPYAGARIYPLEGAVDEAAVWNGTQKVSQVLALFRARYTPAASAPVANAGDPADNDSMGRRADIGAIDVAGHDQDKVGKFGAAPSEMVPPTVTLTAPTAGASITGTTMLTATATDNAGGSGVVLVQFLVDGSTVGQDAQAPYALSFNSAVVSNAMHTFAAKAWDAAGNFAVSAPVMATVTGNTPITMPPLTGAAGTSGGGPGAAGTTGGPGAAGTTGGPGAGGATGTGAGGTGGAGGPGITSGKGGCGCALTGDPSGAWFLLLAALALARRRTS